MKRNVIGGLLAALLASQAFAATTWSKIGNNGSRAVSTTGSEAAPSGLGTSSAPVGMDLWGAKFFTVRVCAAEGETITTGGPFDVYFYDASDGQWAQWSSSSLSTGGNTGGRCYELEGDSVGRAIPNFRTSGRVAIVPNGVVTSGDEGDGYLTISIQPSDANGNPR